jgi:hypothetical protein
VAAQVTEATGLDVEVVEGARGEFTVWVDGTVVARKDSRGFPADDDMVAAVKRAAGR